MLSENESQSGDADSDKIKALKLKYDAAGERTKRLKAELLKTKAQLQAMLVLATARGMTVEIAALEQHLKNLDAQTESIHFVSFMSTIGRPGFELS